MQCCTYLVDSLVEKQDLIQDARLAVPFLAHFESLSWNERCAELRWHSIYVTVVKKNSQPWRKICMHAHRTDQFTCSESSFQANVQSLHGQKPQSLTYVIIASHFLTLSFIAACAISGKRNGWFGFSAVSSTAISGSVVLLSVTVCLDAQQGGERWNAADSVLTCWSVPSLGGVRTFLGHMKAIDVLY